MIQRTDREMLIEWLNLFSLQKGEEFTLASGQKSNMYVDVKKTSQHNRVHKLLAKLLFDKMVEKFAMVEAVAGVVLGGCHLSSIVAMHAAYLDYGLDVIHVRKESKGHGTKNLLERPNMTEGQYVVLLEDVVTTGGSALKAARAIKDAGFIVKGILAVVDRRPVKSSHLGNLEFQFESLINFEELTY